MKRLIVLLFLGFGISVFAAESATQNPSLEADRARKRLYSGGRDEEDLKVLAVLPEAAAKTNDRQVQKEVYKKLFDQELKDDSVEGEEPEVEH